MMQQLSERLLDRKWAWTMVSGLFTMALAIVAFLLPTVEWMPRGGLVGWLLLLAGASELIFGWTRGLDAAGKAAVGSGVITVVAGLLFVANPLAGYFPVANVVTIWLFLRGGWVLAMGLRVRGDGPRRWLALSGAADVLLGMALIVGLPVASLVVALFGPTRQIVARFALILAASFAITGISQVAMALVQRQRSKAAR